MRESKLRQEMELAATQHASELQALRSEATVTNAALEAVRRDLVAVKDDHAEKVRRNRVKMDDIEAQRSALQRELNLATRDIASKEFKIEKLVVEVEELRNRLARQDEAARTAERDVREQLRDTERELDMQRRQYKVLETKADDQAARLEELQLQRGEQAEKAGGLVAEIRSLQKSLADTDQQLANVSAMRQELEAALKTSEAARLLEVEAVQRTNEQRTAAEEHQRARLEEMRSHAEASKTATQRLEARLETSTKELQEAQREGARLEERIQNLEAAAVESAEALATRNAELAAARGQLQRQLDEISEVKANHTVHSAEVLSQLKERESTFEIMVQTQANQQRLLQEEAEAARRGLADEVAVLKQHREEVLTETAELQERVATLQASRSVADATVLELEQELSAACAALATAEEKCRNEEAELSEEKVRRLTEQDELMGALSEAKAKLYEERSRAEKLVFECNQNNSRLEMQEAIAAESQHLQHAAVEAESVMLERIHALEEV